MKASYFFIVPLVGVFIILLFFATRLFILTSQSQFRDDLTKVLVDIPVVQNLVSYQTVFVSNIGGHSLSIGNKKELDMLFREYIKKEGLKSGVFRIILSPLDGVEYKTTYRINDLGEKIPVGKTTAEGGELDSKDADGNLIATAELGHDGEDTIFNIYISEKALATPSDDAHKGLSFIASVDLAKMLYMLMSGDGAIKDQQALYTKYVIQRWKRWNSGGMTSYPLVVR